jgi:hypothetical protein
MAAAEAQKSANGSLQCYSASFVSDNNTSWQVPQADPTVCLEEG